jgi:transcriptional regulator with XRE-family HTH domain
MRPANQIRRYRRRRNLKLRQVAKLAGLQTPSHLSHWEAGRKAPSLENALRLSAIIQCPVEILFYDLFNAIRHDVFLKRQSSSPQHNDA